MHSKNFLSLFAVLTAAAHLPVRDSAPSPRLDVAASNNNATPRNAVYSTLWKDPTLKGLGPHTPLLPLVQHNSTVTHVYLFNLEVKSNGSTFLNNVTYNSHHYDWLLNETKTLQSKGVKVMASAGGAGASIWPGLEDKVRLLICPSSSILLTRNTVRLLLQPHSQGRQILQSRWTRPRH